MDTVRKKNVSGVDLEVAVMNFGTVKAGEEADLPTHYPWHRDPSGDDPGDPAPIVWPEANWEDVATSKTKLTAKDATTGTTQGTE